MDINVYDLEGKKIFVINQNNPVHIGSIIDEIPLKIVPFKDQIDIKKTINEINNLYKMKAESILMVDDDRDFLKISKHWLVKLGHYVETYDNADSAFSILSNNKLRFDRIIIDQKMPVVSGAHLIKSLEELELDIKIILLTAQIKDVPSDISSKYLVIQKPCNMVNIVGAASKYHITRGISD